MCIFNMCCTVEIKKIFQVDFLDVISDRSCALYYLGVDSKIICVGTRGGHGTCTVSKKCLGGHLRTNHAEYSE